MLASRQSHLHPQLILSTTTAVSGPSATQSHLLPPVTLKGLPRLLPIDRQMKLRSTEGTRGKWVWPRKQAFMTRRFANSKKGPSVAEGTGEEDKRDEERVDGEIEGSTEAATDFLSHSDPIANVRSECTAPQKPGGLPVRPASSSLVRKQETLNPQTQNLAKPAVMANTNPFNTSAGNYLEHGVRQRSSPGPQASTNPTLQNLTQFMNADLVQQKRLKANNSQVSKAANDFNNLKQLYKSSFTVPPMTTSAVRAQIYSKLRQLCTRYDDLLELRRQMLEKHQAWLEQAISVPMVKDSAHLELAIDLQIDAARDLAAIQEEGKLKKELETLMQSN